MALDLHVGGIGQQQAHALPPGEGGEVVAQGTGVAQGHGVQLEVAGVDDAAHRRFHGQGIALGNGMTDRDKMKGEIAKSDGIPGVDRDQFRPLQKIVLGKLVLRQGQGERRSVQADTQTFALDEKPGQGSDMVLVTVGQNDVQCTLRVREQRLEAGNDHIHAP